MKKMNRKPNVALVDPSGKEDAAFLMTMSLIEEKLLDLKRRILEGEIG